MSALSINPNMATGMLPVHRMDHGLILSSLALLLIGLVMISSASVDVADVRNNNPFHYLIRHGVFVGMGLIAGLIAYQLPISWWQKSGWLLLSASLVMLLLVLIVGKTVNGSTRWIGLGSINIQPSEVAKLFLVAYLAGYLVRRHGEVTSSWWGFMKPMLVLCAAAVLLLAEPDFGATVVIGCAFLGMIFLSGVKLGQFAVLIAGSIGMVVVLILSQPYRLKRLTGYTDPWADQFGAGYQLTQSLIAFGRGEWFGVGLGNSIQKQFYLPEAHTDFVFAIIAEEFGLIGSFVVVILFSVLVYRALAIGFMAERSGKLFEAFFAYGIALLIGIQAFINLGVNMGLLPTKGLTLPLVSYGGSSLIVSCVCIGVLARIYRDMSGEASESQSSDQSERGPHAR